MQFTGLKSTGLAYWQLMRFDKPIGTLLLLWPTLSALWLAAKGLPPWPILIIFTLGVILMRALGCILNDLADRDIDIHVARTRTRPLADGRLSAKQALTLAMVLALAALSLALCLNWFSLCLAFIAAVLTAAYPLCKRFFAVPQLVLGITFNFGILMAYSQLQNQLPQQAWLLYFSALIWTVAYDTAYAMADRPDDLKLGLHSSAIFFSRFDRLAIAICQGLCLLGLAWLGISASLSWPYWLAWLAQGSFFAYQQQLIKKRVPTNCFRAFLNNQWVGLALWLGCMLSLTS